MKKTIFICLIMCIFLTVNALGKFGDIYKNYSIIKQIVKTSAVLPQDEVKPAIKPNNNYVAGTRFAKPIPDIDINDTSTDVFFENSAFFGDSLMEGFGRYCEAKGNGFLGSPLFFAVKSFSLNQAIKPLSESVIHLVWQGKEMLVEDIIAQTGVKRAFLFFGINDMVGLTPDETINEYSILLYRIHTKAPDCKIYILGPTYMYNASQRENLNNKNLREFNNKMYNFCEGYDYMEFINIGDRLIDGSDGLQQQYSSDSYVHVTSQAYDVWVKVLRAYALYFAEHERENEQNSASR